MGTMTRICELYSKSIVSAVVGTPRFRVVNFIQTARSPGDYRDNDSTRSSAAPDRAG
jgi:hypothetical protein